MLGSVQSAHAELVANGGFSNNTVAGSYASSFINGSLAATIADWAMSSSYSFLVSDGTSVTSDLNASGNGPDPVWGTPITGYNGNPLGLNSTNQSVSSPTGSGWFVVSNGSYGATATLTQNVSGFTIGREYDLSFYQAAGQQQGFTGGSSASWNVKIGNDLVSTPSIALASQGAITPWALVTHHFTAPASNLTLEFTSGGTPDSSAPFALLAGVSIVESTTPPPPSVPGPLPAVGAGMTLAWSRKLRRRIADSIKRQASAES